MMADATLSDYEWLVSDAARASLQLARTLASAGASAVTRLRRDLSPARAHLVVELTELRARAQVKFSRAQDMFLTRQSLEQATDAQIAAYKATRFPQGVHVADLGCGLGGDLLALAARGPVTGVERDPILARFAAANARVLELATARVQADPIEALAPGDFAAWHCDPDRRASGQRTTALEFSSPSGAELERWRAATPNACVKLAPAAEPPAAWRDEAELEWIGHDRECKQLLAWFGALARAPGSRCATIIDRQGNIAASFSGCETTRAPLAAALGPYLFEPHAAILAAQLGGALAAEQQLEQLAPGVAYFTGNNPVAHAGLAGFEVTEALPFDRRKLKARLRERGIGRLEIKKRGLPNDPAKLWRELDLAGPNAAVLILTRVPQGNVMALLARRLGESGTAAGPNISRVNLEAE